MRYFCAVLLVTALVALTASPCQAGRRGWLKDLKENEAARKAFKTNDWYTYRIEAKGDHIQTAINGVPAADIHDPHSKSGFIGLQVHGVGRRTNDLEVRFRNVFVKEISNKP